MPFIVSFWLCVLIVSVVVLYVISGDLWWRGETQERVWFQTSPVSSPQCQQSPDLPILIFISAGRWWLTTTLHPTCPKLSWTICLCVVLSLATLLCHCALIGWWVPGVDPGLHVTGSWCHLAPESQISTVMLELYSRQIYTVKMVIIPGGSGQICHHLHMMTALWSGDVPRPGDTRLHVTVKCIIDNQPPPPRKCVKWFKIVTSSGIGMTHDNNVGTFRRVSIMISIYQISKNCCNLAFLQRRHSVISGLRQWQNGTQCRLAWWPGRRLHQYLVNVKKFCQVPVKINN